MKKYFLSFLIVLFLQSFNLYSLEEEINAKDGSYNFDHTSFKDKELNLGAIISEGSVSPMVKYWPSRYFGFLGYVGISREKYEVDSNEYINLTSFGLGGAALFGFTKDIFRPHLGIGLNYGLSNNLLTEIRVSGLDLSPFFDLDILVSDRFCLTLGLFGFSYILSGTYDDGSTDNITGYDFSFLDNVTIAYRF
ncbi:MAG: hypothetical protein ABIA04_00405 [Pseudomonadota bacterium]